MNFEVLGGVYPTMITPYKNGEVDIDSVKKLTRWFWEKGCDGIFADCQSSEIMYLSLEERIQILHAVLETNKELSKDKSRKPMMIVASGHVSNDFTEQVKELNAIANEKPDALILISNRMDIENTSDDAWIADTQKLVSQLPKDMPLGMYECPMPYKRLLTEKMIKYMIESDRFYFIKDTCCDAKTIKERAKICEGSHLKIFNANAQTLLETKKYGVYGYCGIMGNIMPDLYCKLWRTNSQTIQDYICISTILEWMTYPLCAKYYLNKYEGIPMDIYARSADNEQFTEYQMSIVDQYVDFNNKFKKSEFFKAMENEK